MAFTRSRAIITGVVATATAALTGAIATSTAVEVEDESAEALVGEAAGFAAGWVGELHNDTTSEAPPATDQVAEPVSTVGPVRVHVS